MMFLTREKSIAAKPDAKSGYLWGGLPYDVFITMNRKEQLHTSHVIIAEPAIDAGNPAPPAHAYPGFRPGRHMDAFSGVRSSGQYCCQKKLPGGRPTGDYARMSRGCPGSSGHMSASD